VGDLTSRAALSALELIAPVQAVHGNMDEPELRAELPERRIV
jgi:predicted phosphodiesterase